MSFLLEGGDLILAKPVSAKSLRFGDLVVVKGRQGREFPRKIVHRYLGKFRKNGRLFLITRGDAQVFFDEPVPQERLLGKVFMVRRSHGWISLEAWWSRAIHVPIGAYSSLIHAAAAVAAAVFRAAALFAYPRASAAGSGPLSLLFSTIDAWFRGAELILRGILSIPAGLPLRLLGAAALPRLAPPAGLSGRLENVTLRGTVKISGDIVIPAGSTVVVEPGTRLIHEGGLGVPEILRPTKTGWRPATHRSHRNWIVYGALDLRGDPSKPVELSGKRPAHFLFLGRSRGRLESIQSAPGASASVSCWDWSKVVVAGSELRLSAAVSAFESARLTVRDSSFSGPDTALCADDRAALLLLRTSLRGFHTPLSMSLRSRTTLTECVISGGAFGPLVSGAARIALLRCRLTAVQGAPLRLLHHSETRSRSTIFESCGAGVQLRGQAAWRSSKDRLTGFDGAAVQASDKAHYFAYQSLLEQNGVGLVADGAATIEAEGLRISRCDQGIRIAELAHATLKETRISNCGHGILQLDRSTVKVAHAACDDCGSGWSAEGSASISAKGLSISRAKGHGMSLKGNAAFRGDLTAESCGEAGLFLAGNAAAELVDGRLDGNRTGLLAISGRSILASTSAFNNHEVGCDFQNGEHVQKAVRIVGSPIGIGAYKQARVNLEGCEITGCGTGAFLQDASSLDGRALSLTGCGIGCIAEGAARFEAADLEIFGAGSHGIWLKDKSVVTGNLTIASCGGPGIYLTGEEASLFLSKGILRENRAGLMALSGHSRLCAVLLEKNREIGISLQGGRHVGKELHINDSPIGLGTYRQARTDLEGCEIANCATGFFLQDASIMSSSGLLIKNCEVGCIAEGAARFEAKQAEILCSVSHGIWLKDNSLLTGFLTVRDSGGPGLYLTGDSRAELSGGGFFNNRTGMLALAGSSRLANMDFIGNREIALSVHGGRHSLQSGSLRDSPSGLETYGDGRLEFEHCRVSRCRQGAHLQDRSILSTLESAIEDCGIGCIAEANSSIEANGLGVTRSASHGVWLKGCARLAGILSAARCGGPGIYITDEARAELCGGRLQENRAGLLAMSGTAVLRDVSLEANLDIGISLQGGRHRLEATVLGGSPAGIGIYGETTADLTNCRLELCQQAISLFDRAVMTGRKIVIAGCNIGCVLENEARCEAERLEISGARLHGFWLKGKSLLTGSLIVRGCGGPGVYLTEEARAELTGGELTGNRVGLLALSGTSLLRKVNLIENREIAFSAQTGTHRLLESLLRDSPIGVGAHGRGRVELEGTSIGACHQGVLLQEEAALSAKSATITDCELTCIAEGSTSIDAEGLTITRSASHGVWLKERAFLLGRISVSSCGGPGVYLTEEARAELTGGELTGNRVGLAALSSESEIQGVAIVGNRETGCGIEGGSHRLTGVRIEGSPTALSVHNQARVELVDCRFSSSRYGVLARDRAFLTARGVESNACEVGWFLEGASSVAARSAKASDCSLHGIWLTDFSYLSGTAEVSSCAGTGIYLDSDAVLELTAGRVHGNRAGIVALSGTSKLENLEVFNNRKIGLSLQNGFHRLVSVSVLGSSLGVGVYATTEAELLDCRIAAAEVGIACMGRSHTLLARCAFTGGRIGLWLQEHAHAKAFLCRFSGHAPYGARISHRAQGMIHASSFIDNRGIALLAEEGGCARVDASIFIGNPTGIKLADDSRAWIRSNRIFDAAVDSVWCLRGNARTFTGNRVENSRRIHEPLFSSLRK